jgi:hypothetical protein
MAAEDRHFSSETVRDMQVALDLAWSSLTPEQQAQSSKTLLAARIRKMKTREARLAEFNLGIPRENRPLQILCEDQCGTYIIPYPCQWSDGAWRKVGSAKTIEATVIGWRTAPRSWR